MTPLDQVVRDRIDPALREAGFTRKARTFSRENDRGDRLVLEVQPFRLGRHDAEFFLDLHAQPRVWRDFLNRDGGETHAGVWSDRLRPPGRAAGGMNDLWSLDLGDEPAGRQLSEAVASALPELLSRLEATTLLAHARATAPPGRPSAVVAALLATQGPSGELDDLLAALSGEAPDERPGFDTPGFVAFLRDWMAEHARG